MLSETFIRILTACPGLELEREKVKPEPEAADLEELLSAVPFSVGAEYITENWIRNMFDRLCAVFAEEIKAYDGTVALYLAGKNQHLHVAERIFFHLVESKDEEYAFAFLATYATRQENGKVGHVPLK